MYNIHCFDLFISLLLMLFSGVGFGIVVCASSENSSSTTALEIIREGGQLGQEAQQPLQ